jgi:hypothetical protein
MEDKIDRVARIVAAVLYHPAPDMSGDIWKAVPGEGPKRRCRRAAEDILRIIEEEDME